MPIQRERGGGSHEEDAEIGYAREEAGGTCQGRERYAGQSQVTLGD